MVKKDMNYNVFVKKKASCYQRGPQIKSAEKVIYRVIERISTAIYIYIHIYIYINNNNKGRVCQKSFERNLWGQKVIKKHIKYQFRQGWVGERCETHRLLGDSGEPESGQT